LRDIVPDPRCVSAIDRLHEEVRNGRRSPTRWPDDLLPPLAVRMLRVGDETGDLPRSPNHAAHSTSTSSRSASTRHGAIGPITIVVVSLIIGALFVSIMSALLSITELAL
jgi:general secretion pathway protein F